MNRNHRANCSTNRPPTPSGCQWCCDCHLLQPVFVTTPHDKNSSSDQVDLNCVFDRYTTVVGGSSEPASYGQGFISTVTLQTFHSSMQESRQWERDLERLIKQCRAVNDDNSKDVM